VSVDERDRFRDRDSPNGIPRRFQPRVSSRADQPTSRQPAATAGDERRRGNGDVGDEIGVRG